MKRLAAAILFLTVLRCNAQDSTKHTIIDTVVTQCEIEPMFPGGTASWTRFLDRHLGGGDAAGTVVVQFIVDKEGKVSDIRAVSGPENGGLREEAIRVIRISGRWVPGIVDGRQVRAYKKVPITFN